MEYFIATFCKFKIGRLAKISLIMFPIYYEFPLPILVRRTGVLVDTNCLKTTHRPKSYPPLYSAHWSVRRNLLESVWSNSLNFCI